MAAITSSICFHVGAFPPSGSSHHIAQPLPACLNITFRYKDLIEALRAPFAAHQRAVRLCECACWKSRVWLFPRFDSANGRGLSQAACRSIVRQPTAPVLAGRDRFPRSRSRPLLRLAQLSNAWLRGVPPSSASPKLLHSGAVKLNPAGSPAVHRARATFAADWMTASLLQLGPEITSGR